MPRRRVRRDLALSSLALAFALVTVVWPKLALIAGLATLLVGLTVARHRAVLTLLVLAAIASVIAIVRFVATEALPGLVRSGQAASATTAVSRLREILFAEDVMRQKAWVDPDGDGVGSAGLIAELSAHRPLRGVRTLDPSPLDRRYWNEQETPIGPASAVGDYLFIVCLPAAGGGWTARPGEPVDEERAERNYVAYAWPAAAGFGTGHAFFLDAHERILVSDNRDGAELRYAGASFPPSCDAAVVNAARDGWRPWRDKKPRRELPGDRP